MAKKGRHNTPEGAQHIGNAIRDLLHAYKIESRFDEANLVSSWENLMGKPVARQTRKVFIRNKVLFVELTSPSLKHDLNLHKQTILDRFFKEFGKEIIQEIVIM